MLLDITYYDRKTKHLVNQTIGKPFSLIKRIQLKGIGSRRMVIEAVSPYILTYLGKRSSLDYASIELRPKGIIVHFRNKMREYIWVIPYYQLQIYQSDNWSIHGQGHFMSFSLDSVHSLNKAFVLKLLDKRASFLHSVDSMPLV